MAVRTPIQVPEELKSKMESLKDSMNAKTHYDLIEKLILRHNQFQKYQMDQAQKWNDEKLRQSEEMLQIGQAAKCEFEKLKQSLNIKEDTGLLAFLLIHYENSVQFDKRTMEYLRKLK